MMRLSLLALLIAGWLFSAAQAADPAPPAATGKKNASPDECWQRFNTATDQAERLACVSDAMQCMIVGQIAAGLERQIFFKTPESKEARELLLKHGLGDLEIMSMLQSAIRPGSEGPILVQIGAWANDRPKFVAEATQFFERMQAGEVAKLKKELEKARQDFAAQIAQTKDPAEIEELKQRQRQTIGRLEANLAQAEQRQKSSQTPPAAKPMVPKLTDVKIEGDAATALVEGAGPGGKIHFAKLNGSWVIKLDAQEPEVKRTEDKQRIARYFTARGIWADDIHGGLRDGPRDPQAINFATYIYAGDDEVTTPFKDADLLKLANLVSLVNLELRNAAGVTPDGFAALKALEKLKSLRIRDMALADESLRAIGKLTGLKRIVLDTVACSDRAVADLCQALPKCKIVAIYSVRGLSIDEAGTLRHNRRFAAGENVDDDRREPAPGRARDPARNTLFLSAQDRPEWVAHRRRLSERDGQLEPSEFEDAALPELIRLLHKHQVAVVIDDLPRDYQDGPAWWKDRPYLKPGSDAIVLFPKGATKPEVVPGEITPAKLLATVKRVLEAAR